jgi:cell wall-associated NlpC family hydrolase
VAEEYFDATGKRITGDSHAQYDLCTPLKPSDVLPGDLLFHNTGSCRSGNCDSHVGVAITTEERVDAMNPAMGIRRGPRKSPYWYATFTRAGRLPW